jgi:glycosyltransferase involved in cell wall biosynthesis
VDKIKILYISSVLPDTTSGARIAIYRHLVVKKDFETFVCGVDVSTSEIKNTFHIVKNNITKRIANSRFSRYYYNYKYVADWFLLPKDLLEAAKKFNPDVIFTVPDNIHSGLAYQLAKKLNKPLATDFQDLFPLSQFIPKYMEPYGWVRKFLLEKFHYIHDNSDVAFYTSEGMKAYFKAHKKGFVLYPVGDFDRPQADAIIDRTDSEQPITIVYAGNNYGSYGNLMLRLAKLLKNSKKIQLKIFPVGKGWSDADVQEMTEAGIYQSFRPFEELKKELKKADAFLTVMSFEESDKSFVTTSFTTKWLDYAPYGKPIFVWSPEYASASIFAKLHKCGVVINKNDENKVEQAILSLMENVNEWNEYAKNARLVSDTVLNPEKIHQVFVKGIQQAVK